MGPTRPGSPRSAGYGQAQGRRDARGGFLSRRPKTRGPDPGRVVRDVNHFSGGRIGEVDRPLDRSIGLEQEFFLLEASGEPSVRADEFLERCRERSEREGDGGASCLAPEWVKGVVEINTPPVRSLEDLEAKYADNVRLAVRSAREIGLRLYPLGPYPLPLEPAVREGADHKIQVRPLAPERFMDAGRCAGTHLHLGLPDGT